MLKVAIVGKPNVGKSSLFNRLINKNKAITDSFPGVTRDNNVAICQWLDQSFEVIDTGGLKVDQFDFKLEIKTQVDYAIQSCDVIIFLVSYKDGIDKDDFYVAKLLKKQKNKEIILVVNKAENKSIYDDLSVFYQLGFSKMIFISVSHGINIGDLLDLIVIKKATVAKVVETFKFCVLGKTNVGKSSLVNAILNKDRMIVSPINHTTRDAIDTDFFYHKEKYTIIDTAGIRKKSKLNFSVDKYAYIKVEKTIARSNLILLILDALDYQNEFSEIDKIIAGLAYKANIPTILVINKWDLIQKETNTMSQWIKKIRVLFKFLSWAPIVFLSAKEKSRINTLFDTIVRIKKKLGTQFSTNALTYLVNKLQYVNHPPLYNGGVLKINYVTQVKGFLPTFVLFCNNPKYLHFSYARFLENEIRKQLNLNEIPLTLYFKMKKDQFINFTNHL